MLWNVFVMSDETVVQAPEVNFNSPSLLRYRKLRVLKDKVANVLIGIGGMSVIVAISLIFFYLL
jgi:phosphate transport system permease protein